MNGSRHFKTALVGCGPAGLAVLLSAHRQGNLRRLLDQGLLILERGVCLGSGTIGRYAINSDSTGETFLDPLLKGAEPTFQAILSTPLAQRIATAGSGAISLRDAGELLGLIGHSIRDIIPEHPQSRLCLEGTVQRAQQMEDVPWALDVRGPDGQMLRFSADQIIVATGASQSRSRLEREHVAGVKVTRWADLLLQSDEVLGQGGSEQVCNLLRGKAEPRVAVLGGSASAMAVSHFLLNRLPDIRFGSGGVTLFHRRPLRLYYTSREEATNDGYTDFGEEDVCMLTSRVYRLAGLRLDSRELLMRLLGVGGRESETRMRMHRLEETDQEAVRLIDQADLVIAAFGYRPNGLALFNKSGMAIPTFAETGMSGPLVDDDCRVMDRQGTPIPGVFGIGLAAGFVPRGKLGGEPSFAGQANGLWLWQTDVGAIIVDQVLKPLPVEQGLGVACEEELMHWAIGSDKSLERGSSSVHSSSEA